MNVIEFSSNRRLPLDVAINSNFYFSFLFLSMIVTERCFPVLYLHGEIAGGPFVSALLEIMLLCVHIAMAE